MTIPLKKNGVEVTRPSMGPGKGGTWKDEGIPQKVV